MAVIELTNENYEEMIKGKKLILKFYATWCGPCKLLKPVFEKASEKTDFIFCSSDVDVAKDLASKYNIKSVPTILLLDDGKVIDQKIGFMNEEAILNLTK